MKKVVLLAVAALTLFAFSGGRAFAQASNPVASNSVTITLNEQNGSGQSGTATLTDENGMLTVVVNLSNGTSTPQPAHIHKGTCANLDPVPAIPLSSLVDGKSSSNIDLTTNAVAKSLNDLLAGQYAVNVHKSAAEVTTYVACGEIVNMQMGGGTTGGTTTGGTTSGGTTSGGELGTTGTPGMPSTGKSDFSLAAILALLALVLTGTGYRLARRSS